MSVLVITPPEPLVTLAEAKAHLRVTTGDEDVLIEGYIAAACAWIDGPNGWLGRSLADQTLEVWGSGFGACERLPYGPVTNITQVKYVDPTGNELTLAPEAYTLAAGHLTLAHGASWPAVRGDAEGVRVQYVAGTNPIPPQARQAVLLLVGQWFRNRMSVVVGTISSELPFGVEALLSPLRRFTP